MFLRGDHHHRVAPRNRRGDQRHETQQRIVVRADDPDHADRFVGPNGHTAQRRFLHRPTEFVSPGRVSEQPRYRLLDLGFRRLSRTSGHCFDALSELVDPRRKVLGDVVENLRAVKRRTRRPAISGPHPGDGVRGLDRIADVFAVSIADLPHERPIRPDHRAGVVAVGTFLLPANVHLGRAIHFRAAVPRLIVLDDGRPRRGVFPPFSLFDRLVELWPGPRLPLRAQIFEQALAPTFAPVATFAVAAEARRRVEQVRAVDPDAPRLDFQRNIERNIDIVRPDACRQPEARIVRQRRRLGRRTEAHRNQHRPEDFLLGHRRRRLDPCQQRRAVEESFLRQRAVRLEQFRAFFDPALDPPVDGFPLRLIDNRANVDALVERIADPEMPHPRFQLVDEPLLDVLLNQQPRPGAADLALVEPDRIDDPLDSAVEIGIVEDDDRRFAAQFQRHPLARSGSLAAQNLAHVGRAGKGDLVDILVVEDHAACFAAASHHVDHPRRQPGLGDDLGEEQRAQPRVRSRF